MIYHIKVDLGALESSNVMWHLDLRDQADLHNALLELSHFGVVICVHVSSIVASWSLKDDAMAMLEPVTRLRKPIHVMTPRLEGPPQDMSIIDLIGLLLSRGFVPGLWQPTKKRKQPPPVLVATQRPKKWWAKPSAQALSKYYLLALVRLADISSPEVHHLESD
jgi:hypothetical protein